VTAFWIISALALVAGTGLYIFVRWRRSPVAYRAMSGVAIVSVVSGSILGAWFFSLIEKLTPTSPSVSLGSASNPGARSSVGSTPLLTPGATASQPASLRQIPSFRYDATHAARPDPKLTLCDVIPGVTPDDVCTPGWAKEHRHVTEEMRGQVYARYGYKFDYCEGPERGVPYQPCDVDHLIPLELGGNNTIANLWPQPISCTYREFCAVLDPRPGAAEKDQLENELHHLVCSGKMSLAEAQHCIALDWVACWEKVFPENGMASM